MTTAKNDLLEGKFPVLNHEKYGAPKFVKLEALDDQWAQRLHNQSLERLAQRGGLDPCEIYWNVNKLVWATEVDSATATNLVKELAF